MSIILMRFQALLPQIVICGKVYLTLFVHSYSVIRLHTHTHTHVCVCIKHSAFGFNLCIKKYHCASDQITYPQPIIK